MLTIWANSFKTAAGEAAMQADRATRETGRERPRLSAPAQAAAPAASLADKPRQAH